VKSQKNTKNSEDTFTEAIRLGAKDSDPRRVTNWCKHIKVEYISTSPLGQMIQLPTLGMKRISCKYGKTMIESVSLDTAATGFFENNCQGCAKHEEVHWDNIFRMRNPVFVFLKFIKAGILNVGRVVLHVKNYIIIFVISCLAYALLQLITIAHPNTVLTTLAQVNSTIFALAFTIPLVASQLGRYRTPIPIFSGFSLAYMLLYISTIFLSLLGPDAIVSFCISLSILCALLLIPYLRWVKDGFSSTRVIERQKNEAVSSIKKNNEASFREAVDNIYNMAVESLHFKDYSTFTYALDGIVKLTRHAYFAGLRVSTEQEYAWLFVGLRMQRIGEMAVEDRFALQSVCDGILRLDTEAEPIQNRLLTLPLKSTELVSLCVLAKLASEKNGLNALPPVEALFRLVMGTLYENHKDLEDKIRKDTIKFLVTLPEKIIDDAYSDLENKYQVKYGGGILKIALLGQLAKLYLDYRDTRFPKRKMKRK